MPVPTHFRFVVRGIFVGTEETWSNVTHFSRNVTLGDDAGLGDVREDDVDTAVATFYGSGFVSPLIEVSDWRMYQIGTNGKMQGNGPKLREYAASELRGGAGTTPFPAQVALAISTVAPDRGAAQFGRFYLPGPTRPIDGTFRLSVSDAGTYVSIATQFLKDVSDAIDLPETASSSGVHVSKGPVGSSVGTLQVIDHVRVGRVYDTIQSRRRSLLEDYQVSGHIDW
jgi:hypothetical protein